jgi:putative Mn2+ efflux pump MntP
MSLPFPRWGRLLFSLVMIGLGIVLASDQSQTLPVWVQQYWPVVLIVWGVALFVERLRSRVDMWAGTDYGTGLYVIRHRRRRPSQWLPALLLMALGGLFLATNLDPASSVWFGPLVLIALGVVWLISSFNPPPRKDF